MAEVWGQFGGSKGPPRDPLEHPNGGQESPKTLSRPSSDQKRRSHINIKVFEVGGSSWELNIDPKRPQEKRNDNFEEARTRRSEKKR